MISRGILLTGIAVLLPPAMAASASHAAITAVADHFQPPSSPMTLTRTLYRSLSDGKQIVISRRYAIRFSAEGDGFRLDGELIDTAVDAPAVLANLAEIERNRPDHGLFPATLDSHGMIRSGTGDAVDRDARDRALGGAEALIDQARLPLPTRQESSLLLGQVSRASNGTVWPVFLFNPGEGERVESRSVTLPDGSVGEVEVRIRAEGVMPGGLPRLVERKVITRLSGTVRTTREVWTIAP